MKQSKIVFKLNTSIIQLVKRKFCSDKLLKLEDTSIKNNFETENLLSLNKDLNYMYKRVEFLEDQRRIEVKKIVNSSNNLKIVHKIKIASSDFSKIPLNALGSLEPHELKAFSAINDKIFESKETLIKKQKHLIDYNMKISPAEKLSVEVHKISKLITKNPKFVLATGFASGCVVLKDYFETTKFIIKEGKKIMEHKQICENIYSNELLIANKLSYSPYFKTDEPF